jgi:FtsP/CotA-like multicopper oxidase with cupredoxin domain
VVRLTPPREGTFIYHTHADELAQMTGGLYGALLVLPPGAPRDTTERLIVLADSAAPDMKATPPSMINGSSAPRALEMRAGVTHRIRFIGITAVTARRVRVLDDTMVASWKLLAKDGRDLPESQRVVAPAVVRLGAGETVDVAFTPAHPGRFTLEVTALFGVPRVTRVDIIVGLAR